MADEASPGWGAVLLGVAIGSAVGYRAARRGAWGASEEHTDSLRDAWDRGYAAGFAEADEAATVRVTGAFARGELFTRWERDHAVHWAKEDARRELAGGAGYMAGHNDGVRAAFEVADRDHASAADARGAVCGCRGRTTRAGFG